MPSHRVMAIERLLTGSMKDQVQELVSTEDLVIEAVRDLVKDELKDYIREKINSKPELKDELKETVTHYFNAKARSLYAEVKATRSAAKLGIALLPDELQDDFSQALFALFEKEIGNVLERVL